MTISSIHNPRIQKVRSLLSSHQSSQDKDFFVIEGVRLAEEASASGFLPEFVLVSSLMEKRAVNISKEFKKAGSQVEVITPELFKSISATETPQGILAVFHRFELPIRPSPDFIIIADQMRDPGNLGTLLRTAAAAGVNAVLVTEGSVDPFSPKVVRSAMGAHFHIPILKAQWNILQNLLKKLNPGIHLMLAESEKGNSCWSLDLTQPLALVIGGEAQGASQEVVKSCDISITIPMPGGFESLNAAIAAGILIFEVVRQRSK